jgi:D-sedoheptulose 7-phosphate isomerase
MTGEITRQFEEHQNVIRSIAGMTDDIAAVVGLLASAFTNGNKLLVMGNGGSAADSQHFVGEMIGRFMMERAALPAVALSTDSSVLTCLGNDYGFDTVFRRQVEALATAGDVVFGISTSGNSPNVLKALQLAREKGCVTIGLLGRDGGSIKELCDVALIVPSHNTPRIQEGHITIIHIICDLVEKKLFG